MPSTRHVTTREAPLPATTSAQEQHRPFTFPRDRHLLITTPRHIFAWDAAGVTSVFQSSKGGIVAAREAKDGSGLLAVASRNVVVMHHTKRGKEQSWGLNAPQEEVRHLEYSNDAKSLFLSTTSDGTIQHYSTERSRLLDPAHIHSSSPVALAVSSTGHMILSASNDPPAIYLKNLTHNTTPTLVHPNASTAPVSTAMFHPERANVFMLAFRDGTVAAYDASKISKEAGAHFSQASVNDGEISRIVKLHRSVVSGDTSLNESGISAPIVGVAFLPGFKTRAVTAGRDGRCRLVDFAKKGEILRTWHAKAPVTSISVLPVKSGQARASQRSIGAKGSKQSSHTIGGPTTTDSVIAVGRVDGKVNIYDTVGLLLVQKTVSSQEERILSVEWVHGDSPTQLDDAVVGHFSDTAAASLRPTNTLKSTASQPQPVLTEKELPSLPQNFSGVGLSSALRSVGKGTPPGTSRKFTVHPDELEAGTVRYTPSSNKELAVPAVNGGYNDLFSPIKPVGISASPPNKHVSSPPRSRPRISSQTFIRGPTQEDKTKQVQVAASNNESHSTSSNTAMQPTGSEQAQTGSTARRAGVRLPSPSAKRRRILFNPDALYVGGDATMSRTSTANQRYDGDAKILADLRGLAGISFPRKAALLSTHRLTSRKQANSTSKNNTPCHQAESLGTEESAVHGARTWPNTVLPHPRTPDEDIWLTSGSEAEANEQKRRRPRRQFTRPPGRQTSRSQVNSRGTMSTTAELLPSDSINAQNPVDGSTDQDMITAREDMSPEEPFSPASDNVRKLFPRSSSLSPRKGQFTKTTTKLSPTRDGATLTEMALNAALGRRPKSPWARLRAKKPASSPRKPTMRSVRKNEFVTVLEDLAGDRTETGGLPRSGSLTCLTCPETKARVQALEGEVAHLRGEVLALKAVLRQNGLPFPACLR